MSTVEAAASLFGPEEPSDPFATLGSEVDHATQSSASFYDHDTSLPGDSFLNGDHSDLPAVESEPSAAPSSHPDPATLDHHVYHADSYTHNTSTRAQSYDDPQGWYDEHGQWHAYEQPPAEAPLSEQMHNNVQDYSTPSNPYDPYAPKMTHSQPSHDTQHAIGTQPSYDPYNPNVQASNNYTPSVPASQRIYDPYNPAGSTSFQQTTVSQTTTYSYSTAFTSSAKPTTARVTAPVRPKVSNAYDPPFVPPKPSRRTPARPVPPPAPGVFGQQAYSTYDSAPTIPPGRPDVPYSRGVEHNANLAPGVPKQSHPGPSQYGSHPGHTTDASTDPHLRYVRGQHLYGQGSHMAVPQPPNAWTPHASYNDHTPNKAPLPPASHARSVSPYSEDLGWAGSQAVEHSDPVVDNSPANAFQMSESTFTLDDGFAETDQSQHRASVPKEVTSPVAGQFHSQGVDSSFQNEPDVLAQQPSLSYKPSGSTIGDSYSTHLANHTESTSSPSSLASHSRNNSGGSERYSASQSENFTARPPHSGIRRTLSPESIPPTLPNGTQAHQRNSVDYYQPPQIVPREKASSPPATHAHHLTNDISDPYAPDGLQASNGYGPALPRKTSSLAVLPGNPSTGANAYSPPMKNDSVGFNDNRARSMSSSSVYSSMSASAGDPYAPSQRLRQHPSETSDYGNYVSRYNYPNSYDNIPLKAPPTIGDHSSGQELLVGAVTQTPYAPSPSLLGSNDPLGRTAARVPVFSFGFGGKLVTCFHGSSVLNTGFDVALSSRRSMDVNIRVLSKIIPDSALDTSVSLFPGPLFSDPGSPTVSLVRTGTTAKSKKANVIKYLVERAEEISRGIGYLQSGSPDRRKLEGKLVLVKLLKVMVENDGSLSGTPQVDAAVRAALVPRLEMSGGTATQDTANSTPALGFSSTVDMHSSLPDLSSVSYPGLGLTSQETPISVSTLRPSALDKIQEFLLRGERHKAYYFALDEKLWAHAMVIASSIDKEAWKEVVNEFLKTGFGVRNANHGVGQMNGAEVASRPDGRESLRVVYSMFSGQGAAAVQELLPQKLLSRVTGGLHVPPTSHITPMTPNFSAVPPQATNIPAELLCKWPETAAMMLSSPMNIETSSALTALGDYLWTNQWIEAAHSCYLLTPQTSPIGGAGIPASRVVLLGSLNPASNPSFHKDPDPIIFTEIAEFAMSLAPPVKGQEAFNGLPHLQAYKLIRASSLVEVGQVQLASRYCEAITGALHRSSPYFTATFVEQLKWLSDRIVGAPHIEKSGSWIGGKMTKPSLDGIGSWLEGRFTQLITGDPSPVSTGRAVASEDRTFGGPFSHYSTISSAASSASSSPQPSTVNLNVLPPPRRTGSAMAYPLAANSHVQIDRASSAMDHIRRKPSPPRVASANALTTTFDRSPSLGIPANDYSPNNNLEAMTPKPSSDATQQKDEPSWWGSSYISDSSAQTPTAASFVRVDDPKISSSSGFVSLMDGEALSVGPANSNQRQNVDNDDDVEDLGFGNSSKRDNPPNDNDEERSKTPPSAVKVEPAKPPPAANSSNTGWFSRFGLWGKREATPGPIKASLGEEKTFYYDKELKRWVNKAAGEAPSKPADPPPPPSRAQTASPGRSANAFPPGSSADHGPPNRPASVNDLGASQPTKSVPRTRSNLVPRESESASTPPMTSSSGPPPPSRPRSQATKRNIRSRYVDILQ